MSTIERQIPGKERRLNLSSRANGERKRTVADRNGNGLSDLVSRTSSGLPLTDVDLKVISFVDSTDWSRTRLRADDPTHRELGARTLALGGAVMYPFGNFYALAMGPEISSVQAVNLAKGRPIEQTASIVTTPDMITKTDSEGIFDLTQLPKGMSVDQALEMIHTFFAMGPFGIRGRAAEHIVARHPHLTQKAEISSGVEVPTVQIIAPGYQDAYSNGIIGRAMELSGYPYMAITSANLSSHRPDAVALREILVRRGKAVPKDEPAHWQMRGIQEEFGGSEFPFVLLANPEEQQTVASYPRHVPMSTSLIGFHRDLPMQDGRPTVSIERHGSLPVSTMLEVLNRLHINALVTKSGVDQLSLREYDKSPIGRLGDQRQNRRAGRTTVPTNTAF